MNIINKDEKSYLFKLGENAEKFYFLINGEVTRLIPKKYGTTITNEYEAKVKNLNFKLKLADEKIISLESSLEKYISFKQENDKLKEKMKEYSSFYEIEKKLTEREIII